MEQKEFEQRLGLVESIIKDASSLRSSMEDNISKAPEMLKNLTSSLSLRDSSFIEYLNLLKDFSFSDQLTTPSELFPGIRTASAAADPTELSARATKMKELAGQIDVLQKKTSLESKNTIKALKDCLSSIAEYSLQEAQVYDLAIELLQDADSIYDIGQIAKNT